MRIRILALCIALVSATVFGLNPVLVDSGGTGNFTTIQAAINSWCVGGANAAETPPFVINIKAGSGPYDEGITLDQAVVGNGNIAGNLEIKSDTPGTKIIVKVQMGLTPATDDGIFINQDTYSVTFRDIVFTRSLTNSPIDELVRGDETAANATLNAMNFYNCVFTEPTVSGDPMVTDKAGALAAPPARGGPTLSANARLLQVWGDVGESRTVILDNCVFYAGTNINCAIRLEGTLGTGAGNGYLETCQINNCLSAYAWGDGFYLGGQNQAAALTVTGTDQTEGPLNCSASIYPAYKGATVNNGHCFTLAVTGNSAIVDSLTIDISKTIAYAPADSGGTWGSSTAARGVTGGSSVLTLNDVIISVPSYGIVDNTRKPMTWNRLTVHSNNTGTAAYYGGLSGAEGSLIINDSIISGLGTKFQNYPPVGGITLNFCSLPTSGPYAIGSEGLTLTKNNVIADDPAYSTVDGLLAAFMDVPTAAYAAAGTAGAALAGGADYIGPVAAVGEWRLY